MVNTLLKTGKAEEKGGFWSTRADTLIRQLYLLNIAKAPGLVELQLRNQQKNGEGKRKALGWICDNS